MAREPFLLSSQTRKVMEIHLTRKEKSTTLLQRAEHLSLLILTLCCALCHRLLRLHLPKKCLQGKLEYEYLKLRRWMNFLRHLPWIWLKTLGPRSNVRSIEPLYSHSWQECTLEKCCILLETGTHTTPSVYEDNGSSRWRNTSTKSFWREQETWGGGKISCDFLRFRSIRW